MLTNRREPARQRSSELRLPRLPPFSTTRKRWGEDDIPMMAGEALRGRQWRTPLSRDLNVTDRTIGNRAAGLGCPTGLIERMLPLLRARQKQMHLVIALAERHQNR